MRYPAALPAAAILAGSAAACFTPVPALWPALLSVAAWLAAAESCRRSRLGLLAAAVSAAFMCASWSLAVRAFRDAESPPLVKAFAGALPSPSPVAVEGRLRSDALRGANGVALDLETGGDGASAAASPSQGRSEFRSGRRPSALPHGGLRLTVAGTLAGERAGEWRAGRTVAVSASVREPARSLDPGVPDSRLDLARRGTVLVGGVKSAALVEVVRRGSWFEERAAVLRAFARRAVSRQVGRWNEQSAAIVIAILIGDRVGLSDEVQERLRAAGTYHVIAISGGNIAILAALMFGLLRALRVPVRGASPLVMAGLAAYAALVGGGASVVRATVMACSYLAARQFDYRSPPLNALGVACAAILVASPLTLVDAGFALTFGATLGILVGADVFSRPSRQRWWLRAPRALLLASLSAELALFPVSAHAFSRVTFAGLILNFLAIPLMSVAQVAGMLVLPLAALESRLAPVAGWLAHAGAEGLVRTSALVDLAPWSSWRLPPPHCLALIVYYGSWCVWLWLRAVTRAAPLSRLAHGKTGGAPTSWLADSWLAAGRARARFGQAACVSIVASGVWILVEPMTLLFPGVGGRLRVTVLDVGHADAILVQLPDRRSFLVDTGGSPTGGFDVGGRVIAPALWALGTRRLDRLVITHGDPDHAGGAASVFRDFRPREVWEGVPVSTCAPLAALREQARRAGAGWRERRAGETVALGGVTLRVLHPPPPDWERRKVRNDDSLVLELCYGEVSLVLAGDVGSAVERSIAPLIAPARLRVLKVPHHGSSTSSSPEFLAALRPTVAVISAAATTKVSDEVLARYRAMGATVLRTSDDGAVTLTTDGRTLDVETFTGRHMTIGTNASTEGTTKNTEDTALAPGFIRRP